GSTSRLKFCEELDSYQSYELHKALQKYKQSITRYNNEEWNTVESTIPKFIGQLEQWKIGSF
ncbi:uncharacterized protein BYT42DRAFT_478319, partial [Radiomyces spectabilis]|uniref:uncharacterized protein n=1 Tax=Radiomyces spectabilis TaxID=64574 RepID=UPI00222067F9